LTLMQVLTVLRQVFANPDVRRVQGGWLLAITAEWIYLVNLLVLAYLLGGVVGVGVVGMLRTLPAALAGPLLATLADRYPRQRVLLAVHLLRGALILLMALASLVGLPGLLVFGAALAEGIVATLHRATTMSLMPGLARSPQELVASNVSVSLSEGFGVLAGPAMGGLLVASVGPETGLLAGATGFGLAALTVLRVRPAQAVRTALPRPGSSRLRELLGGFVSLRENQHVALLTGLVTAQTFVRGVLTVLLVAVAVELLLIGEGGVGYLNSAIGAGGVLGGLLALLLVSRRSMALPLAVGLALWGLPISGLGLFPSVVLAFALLGVIGAANAVLDVSAFTLLQRTVPNEVRGRVLATLEGLVALSIGIGSLVAPLLVLLAGLQGALVLTGLILPLLAVVSLRWVRNAEKRAIIPERELELLRSVPILAPLPMTVFEQLAAAAEERNFEAGTDIVKQGEPGDCYYIIANGQVDVIHDGRRVAALVKGDGFGEIALLRDVPRTATIRAMTPVETLRLGRQDFLSAVTGSSGSTQAADSVVGARLQALGRD
jgi:MFS family permease